METTDTDRPHERGAAPRAGTGDVLRAAREEAGLDLVDVAKVLRIRPVYLRAIEDGRYQDLPGSAYVIGFIRTYANYLGLDAEEIVRRFKRETEGALDSRPQLDFPAPISDGQLPTRAIILGSLVAAAVAYGGWYYYSHEDAASQLVSELPERLRPLVGQGVTEESAPPKTPESEGGAPAAEEPTAAPTKPQAKAEPQPAGAPAAEAPAAEAPAPAAEPVAGVPSADAGDAAAAASEGAVAEAVPPPPAPPERQNGAAEDLVDLPAVPEDNGHQPSVFGRHNVDSRITIIAEGEAWIQVRDAENRLLLSRLMRAGDRYLVPNRPGLELVTGSAGDTRVLVDGQEASPLGEPGEVRRDIPLDPDYLLAGR